MKTLSELMRTYQSHHTKPITKFTHFIGVPCIILAIQILFHWVIVIDNIALAWCAVVLLSAYYLLLDVSLGLITAMFLLFITYLAQLIAQNEINLFSFIIACFLFVIGWAAQLIGHYYEGKKPAFLSNFLQVFVAPIFLVAELVFALGYRKELQRKIEA